MEKTDNKYKSYLNVLGEELMPAMGCTEPIAIAYVSAVARKELGVMPDRIIIEASNNIIKNVKSVVVPNTGGLKGIKAAAAAGIVAGKADKVLEVISEVTEDEKQSIFDFLENHHIEVVPSKSSYIFNLIVTLYSGETKVKVHIAHFHTNIISITRNDEQIFYNQHCDDGLTNDASDRSFMQICDIIDFAETVDIDDVKDMLQQQIDLNSAIANEGIRGNWGANVGSVLLDTYGTDRINVRARAMAAAGSDARMSGCELPVVIVSGSGNQGLATSIPVIEYAKELAVDKEKLYRALVVSNLVTIHQKTSIGRLSAYCGAVSAGVGSGAGITWLYGGGFEEVAHAIVNALAIVSGIVCDGAKPSCAGKIAAAVDAGILGCNMYRNGQQFYDGDGLVKKGVENSIQNFGRLGRVGMCETDKEIIKMMLDK